MSVVRLDDGAVGVHPSLDPREGGDAVLVEDHELAVQDDLVGAEGLGQRADLGYRVGEVTPVAAHHAGPTPVDPGERPDAVPLELVGPGVVGPGRQGPGHSQHGGEVGRKWCMADRWSVHPMDHPIPPPGREKCVATLDPLAVEDHLHLPVGPRLALVGAMVPDGHLAPAVLAGGDRPAERRVVERVVLGGNGEMVVTRIEGHALRQSPRHEHPVPLEPEVPVQGRGVMLLDHERAALAARRPRARTGDRLGGATGATPGAIGPESGVGHGDSYPTHTVFTLQNSRMPWAVSSRP